MKNLFRILLFVFMLAGAGAANGQTKPRALLLDSVYSSIWVNDNWSLDVKNYRIKDGSARTIESLFKKYNSGTGQFRDLVRTLYQYQGSATIPMRVTDQLLFVNSWDTLVYTHYMEKEIIDTTYTKNWDSQHHSFGSGVKNIFLYNDSLLPVDNTIQVWDSASLSWLNSSRTAYSYNPAMQPLDRIILSWNSIGSTWDNNYKYSDVYDLNNVLINQFEYSWNDTSAVWDSNIRVTYFNNPTSLPNRMVKEVWNPILNEWDTLEQSTYIYNQFNWLMTVVRQNYIQNSGQWANTYLTTYTYSPNGIQKSTTGNVWDSIHLTWITDSYQLIDSASQKLAEFYTRIVDPQTFLITSGIRNLYTYNPTGDTAIKVNQQWNVPGNEWADKTRVIYTYDSNNLLTEDLTQGWESVSQTWINSRKSDYYYSEYIGIDEPAPKVKPCFYANPMEQGEPVNCSFLDPSRVYQFDLITMKGEKVCTETVTGGKTFVLNCFLAAGTYILRITENGKTVYSDKVVVID